jgi:hypothetical protein
MPGLDPGIHDEVPLGHQYCWLLQICGMDCRVKPGNDREERW